jgi:hypothetical protein
MTDLSTDSLYCANHPTVATGLRCNKCNKPICVRCAALTPVGYRCRECVRGQQQVFETALWYDYVIAAALALPLGGLGAYFLGSLGWFVIFLAPLAGGITAEIIRAAVRRRRGRRLALTATIAFVAGSLLGAAVPVLVVVVTALVSGAPMGVGGLALGSLIFFIWPLVFAGLAGSALYARLRGISI